MSQFEKGSDEFYYSKGIFASVEGAENALEKDVAEMTDADARNALGYLDIAKLTSLHRYRRVIKNYVEWCKSEKVFSDVNDGFLNVCTKDIDASTAIAKITIRDSEDLVYSIKKVRQLDEGYAGPVILGLSWLGLTFDEAWCLKENQIDVENKRVFDINGNQIAHWSGGGVSLIFDQYIACNTATRTKGRYDHEVIKDRSVDTFLKRFLEPKSKKFGTEYTKAQCYTMAIQLSQAYQDLGFPPRLTYANIWQSGRHHALWELEQSGVDVLAKENAELVTKVFRGSKNYAGIIWFYKAYKKAFNL